MRWMFAGVLFALAAACAAAGVRDDAPVVRTVPVATLKFLVFNGASRLHILPGGASDNVRIEGPAESVKQVTIQQRGDEVVIANAPADVDIYVSAKLESISMGSHGFEQSASECRVAVSGDSRAHIDRIVAKTVQIFVDGAGRLDVGKMTAGAVASTLDGNAALKSAN